METAPSGGAADPVIEAYMRDVDRTLLRANLRRSVEERLAQLVALAAFADELHRAGKELRVRDGAPAPR